MDRRNFLKTSMLGIAAAAIAPATAFCSQPKDRKSIPGLKISFQEGTAPGATLAEKFDYMERHGVVGFEPGGRNLGARVDELKRELKGRKIEVSAICAGFDGFILAEDPAVKKQFDTTMRDIIVAAGKLGSVGVIMVPAFNGQKPCMPHTRETRDFLVEELRILGDFALENGTTVILEPLNRSEAFYLRLVADAAAICKDTGSKGVTAMGDFWHMTPEETSDYGAFYSGGEYLNHVHIASRARRSMPGEDPEVDDYRDGFRALQEISYQGFVSFECGTKGERETTVPAALQLMRRQWGEVAGI